MVGSGCCASSGAPEKQAIFDASAWHKPVPAPGEILRITRGSYAKVLLSNSMPDAASTAGRNLNFCAAACAADSRCDAFLRAGDTPYGTCHLYDSAWRGTTSTTDATVCDHPSETCWTLEETPTRVAGALARRLVGLEAQHTCAVSAMSGGACVVQANEASGATRLVLTGGPAPSE